MEIFGVYLVNQSSGATHQLFTDRDNMIGRGIPAQQNKKGEILLPHPSISKLHAKIILAPETHRWTLLDLSRHGLTVNGKVVEKTIELKHSDEIQVGPFNLMFYENFKTDDQTAEQPLPSAYRRERSVSESRPILTILVALLLQGVLTLTFPKVLITISLSLFFFSLIMFIKPAWREQTKVSWLLLISLVILALSGSGLGFYRIFFGS